MPHVVFRREARAEVRNARKWYEEQVAGLGLEFARAVLDSVLNDRGLTFTVELPRGAGVRELSH